MKKVDIGILQAPFIVPLSQSNMAGTNAYFAGTTTVPSGTASVTVSTTAVRSNSMILTGVICPTAAVSGAAAPIEVSSLADGISFAIGYSDNAARARIAKVSWWILNPEVPRG